jgi:hypothetical protein
MGCISFIKLDSEIDPKSFPSHAGGILGSAVIWTHLINALNSYKKGVQFAKIIIAAVNELSAGPC